MNETSRTPEHRQRLERVLAQAKSLPHSRDATTLEAARLLQRIDAQRQRIATRRTLREQTRQARAARRPPSAMGLAAGAVGEARSAALRHPIAVGLALGVGVALGPRRLRRLLVWGLPLAWKGWRMAERVGLWRR